MEDGNRVSRPRRRAFALSQAGFSAYVWKGAVAGRSLADRLREGLMPSSKKAQDLEQRLARTERQLIVLQKVSRLMARKLTLPEALQAILDVVVEATGGDSCLIYLIDNDELVLCACSPPH